MMRLPLDYTFCAGLRCERRETCARWTGHFQPGDMPASRPISVAQFADHEGKCDRFISTVTENRQTPQLTTKNGATNP